MMFAKWLTGIFLPALLLTMLLTACENDLNKVKQISALEINSPVDSTLGVDVIYSDSAKVKAHMTTPLMLTYNKDIDPHHEMPKGVKIIFYDGKLNTTHDDPNKHIWTTITSDYAITKGNDRIIDLQRHVVVTNAAGDTFRSEELIWDQNKKMIYTTLRCELNKSDGTDLDGTSFMSNESFTDYRFEHGHGTVITQGNSLN